MSSENKKENIDALFKTVNEELDKTYITLCTTPTESNHSKTNSISESISSIISFPQLANDWCSFKIKGYNIAPVYVNNDLTVKLSTYTESNETLEELQKKLGRSNIPWQRNDIIQNFLDKAITRLQNDNIKHYFDRRGAQIFTDTEGRHLFLCKLSHQITHKTSLFYITTINSFSFDLYIITRPKSTLSMLTQLESTSSLEDEINNLCLESEEPMKTSFKIY